MIQGISLVSYVFKNIQSYYSATCCAPLSWDTIVKVMKSEFGYGDDDTNTNLKYCYQITK